jgi:sulfite exporter TauE/SafE
MNGWISVLVASLLGSLHCVGMCGGLVSFYAGDAASNGARWLPHAAYHSTRLFAYALLGAAAGQLGSALDGFGSWLGFGDLGLMIAGSTLVSWGLPLLIGGRVRSRLLRLGRGPARRAAWLARLETHFATLAHQLRRRPPVWRASALGLSAALLPCGWLYAFVVLAAGTGSPIRGALLLVAFWAGTVPALLGLGLGVARLSPSLRARVPRLSAALLLLVCGFNVASRWPLARAADADPALGPVTPSCHVQH